MCRQLRLLCFGHRSSVVTAPQDYIVNRLGYDYDDEDVERHMREADVDRCVRDGGAPAMHA